MTSRTLKIALAVSLTLNVFVIGAVGGAAIMRHRMVEQRTRPPMGNPLMRVAEKLPEDVRARYIARLRQQGATSRPLMMEARAARIEAAKALSAPQYDPAIVAAALTRARKAEDTMRASLETAVVDFSRDLKPEERRVIAESLRAPSGSSGRRDRDGRSGPGKSGGRDRDDHRGERGDRHDAAIPPPPAPKSPL